MLRETVYADRKTKRATIYSFDAGQELDSDLSHNSLDISIWSRDVTRLVDVLSTYAATQRTTHYDALDARTGTEVELITFNYMDVVRLARSDDPPDPKWLSWDGWTHHTAQDRLESPTPADHLAKIPTALKITPCNQELISEAAKFLVSRKVPHSGPLAFDLLWQFLEIAPSVYERTDDSRGDIGDVFRGAILAFDDLAKRAVLDPKALANRVWDAVFDNGYGAFDGIIGLVAPALGDDGFAQLKSLVNVYADTPLEDKNSEHDAIHFLRELRSSYRADRKARLIKMVLQDIALAEGDTGTYIAQYSPEDLTRPHIAAEAAQLLHAEGKSQEALALLEAADLTGRVFRQEAWDDAFIACLIALDRLDDA